MKRLAALTVLTVITLVLGANLLQVKAQVNSQLNSSTVVLSPTDSPSSGTAPLMPPVTSGDAAGLTAADYATQLTTLQTTLISQLTTYRSDAQAFQTSKDQYSQIHTLAALEEAVRMTRQVMTTRAEVLQTYLATARLTLQYTKGIDTQTKAASLLQLDQLVSDLKLHQLAIANASDRTSLLGVATQFLIFNKRITAFSNQVSLLVSYGNLQSVDDKMLTVKQDLQTQIQQVVTDPLLLAQKQRGLDEVQRNLDQINPTLQTDRAKLDPANAINQNIQASFFAADFSTIYGGLSRSLSYLQELVKNL